MPRADVVPVVGRIVARMMHFNDEHFVIARVKASEHRHVDGLSVGHDHALLDAPGNDITNTSLILWVPEVCIRIGASVGTLRNAALLAKHIVKRIVMDDL